jgi:outer membrane protein assembly factor BamB
MGKSATFYVSIVVLCMTVLSSAADAQWRGPQRDGVYPGEELLDVWPVGGPKLLWVADSIGEGFSSVAVTDTRVFVTGAIEGTGYLFAYNHGGTQIWKSEYGTEWTKSYPGSRTTPVVVGNRIYFVSALGIVHCFDTRGKEIWTVDVAQPYKAKAVSWGLVESLLVDGDTVFCTPGGQNATVVALNRHTGETIWESKGNGEGSAYCSPRLVTHNGTRLIVTMTAKSVIGVDPGTGELLWSHPHVTDYDVNPNTPLYHDGYLLILSGYGTGAQKLKLTPGGTGVEKVWEQATLDSQFGSALLVDGYLYGSGQKHRGWHCVDWETGEVKYTDRALGGKGNIIFADGLAYCYSEKGAVGLVKLSPEKFQVISSFKVEHGSKQHWAHPVIQNGTLYVRHGEVLMAYDISAR